MQLLIALLILHLSTAALALPRAAYILQKATETHGQGEFQIEQELIFQNDSSLPGSEGFSLNEKWFVQADGKLILVVTGAKDLKNQLMLRFAYNLNALGQITKGNKEAFEHLFLIRKSNILAENLHLLGMIPSNSFENGSVVSVNKTSKFQYPKESFLRLSRVGGVVNYAFGKEDFSNGFWVDQDQYLIRKIKFSTGAELSAEQYSLFAKNLNYPRLKTLRWDKNQVNFQLIDVTTNPTTMKQALSENPTSYNKITNPSVKAQIESFYARFR